MDKHSLLMRDSSGKNGKIETMLDYVLSWTLRRAEQKYSNEDTLLYGYCRDILFKLLKIKDYGNIEVISVETWKQWERIDLHANIQLSINGEFECHAILIENKGYTNIHDNQLSRYKKVFDETYSKMTEFKNNLHYAMITCHDDPSRLAMYKEECENCDFDIFPILKLQDNEADDTKSDLFNEFWLRYW